MNGIRRTLVLIGLTLTVIVGSGIPASATFADSVTATTTAGTLTAQPPASVSTGGTTCVSRLEWNGIAYVTVSELEAKVSWAASSTATTPHGVSGYRITAIVGSTSYPITDVGPTTLSVGGTFPIQYAAANIRVTVSTLTSYGWVSAPSQASGVIKC